MTRRKSDKLSDEALKKTVSNLKIQMIKIVEQMNDNPDHDTPRFKDLTFQLTVTQSLMYIIANLI